MIKKIWAISKETSFRIKCFQSLSVIVGLGMIYDVLEAVLLDKQYMVNLLLPVFIFWVIGAAKLKSWCRKMVLFFAWAMIIFSPIFFLIAAFQEGLLKASALVIPLLIGVLVRRIIEEEKFVAEFSEDGRVLTSSEKQWLLVLSLWVIAFSGASLYKDYQVKSTVDKFFSSEIKIKVADLETKELIQNSLSNSREFTQSNESPLDRLASYSSNFGDSSINYKVFSYKPITVKIGAEGYKSKEIVIGQDTVDHTIYLEKCSGTHSK